MVPELSEITIEEPEVIRQGNKFGVKIRSKSPSIHMIRAGIETEIAPIVGTEQQAEDLIKYIRESRSEGKVSGRPIFSENPYSSWWKTESGTSLHDQRRKSGEASGYYEEDRK